MENVIFMKKNLFILLLALVCIPIFGHTLDKRPSTIELAGTCETHENRSLIYPVEAYLDGNQILITFFDATEDVTVSIMKDTDVMDIRTVSFDEFQTEVFDINQYEAGNYTLLITTSRGTNLCGTFYI